MVADLVALAPPLIVAAAFLTGVVMFLRRQLGPAGPRACDDDNTGNAEDSVNDGPDEAGTR
jgi:hypothetical protein